MAPIALQLYTLREAFDADFDATLAAVAAAGYTGVEVAGLHGHSPEAFARHCADLGLRISSNHGKLSLDDTQQSVETALALGSPILVCPWLPPEQFASRQAISAAATMLNEAAATAERHGLAFGYHNHDHEYALVEGKPAADWLFAELAPAIIWELDVYWAAVAEQNPLDALRDAGARARLVHLKDGPADDRAAPMTALGEGRIDVGGVVAAATHAEWLIVELDRCATDMLTAVQRSHAYLVAQGLA